MRERKSPVARVRELPALFDLDDVVRIHRCSRETAAVSCHRWKEMGLVEPCVSRNRGLYLNVLTNSHPDEDLMLRILNRTSGAALITIGSTALGLAGWTTQGGAGGSQFAVMVGRGSAAIPPLAVYGSDAARRSGFLTPLLFPRYPRWHSALEAGSQMTGGLPTADGGVSALIGVAKPQYALADAMLTASRGVGRSKEGFHPWAGDAADLEMDLVEGSSADISAAFEDLGASPQEASELMAALGLEFVADAAANEEREEQGFRPL